MPLSLSALRAQAPQLSPIEFLRWNPLCWVQFFDDTPEKDPSKALSAQTVDAATIERKQREGCAVCFSLQGFAASRTTDRMTSYRNMGIDVDLMRDPDGVEVPVAEIEWRKDWYLEHCLFRFPLRPHWLVETRHGFHVIFRVQPVSDPKPVREAVGLNRRLVAALQGDARAVLRTQLLRVPGCYQFKNPSHPFLCRLLYNAAEVSPHAIHLVRSALEEWEASHRDEWGVGCPFPCGAVSPAVWRDGLAGVPEGQRNVAAASLAGAVLRRLPEELWDVAGWGGLKEWNTRNPAPLPERELRTTFESIARREREKRKGGAAILPGSPGSAAGNTPPSVGNGRSPSPRPHAEQ